MTSINKYVKRSHISEANFRDIVRYFILDLNAVQTVSLFMSYRRTDIELYDQKSPFSGEFEVDVSYFGARHIKANRGRGDRGKTPMFGILQSDGKVYTKIVPDCVRKTLQTIISRKIDPDIIIHSDC